MCFKKISVSHALQAFGFATRLLLFICVLTASLNTAAFANGGGIFYYGVNAAGSPYFKDVPDVYILREDLLIRPYDDRIQVQVTYLLNNTSGYSDLHYAFPVDYWCLRDGDWPETRPANPDQTMEENIKHVEFICNGQTLGHEHGVPQPNPENDHALNINMRVWYFTTLSLPEGVTELTVKYELKSVSVKESGYMGDYANFAYDFSPAGTWGNGTIKELSIVVDVSDRNINNDDFRMGGIADFSRYSFVRQGNAYTRTERDFVLKDAEKLHLSFSYHEYAKDLLIGRRPASNVFIKTSSVQKRYPVSNLTDLDFSTAWVAGKSGYAWIEIDSKDYETEGIAFLPGYYKSEETYKNNNRIKGVRADFYSSEGKLLRSETREFPDRPYRVLDYTNFYDELIWVFGFDYDYETGDVNNGEPWLPGKVRITILDVYPGEKHDDTCVSEIFVK